MLSSHLNINAGIKQFAGYAFVLCTLLFCGLAAELFAGQPIPDITVKGDVIKGNTFEQLMDGPNLQQKRAKMVPWTYRIDTDYENAPKEAIEKFNDLKIGMRIHWGVYCLNGSRPSWTLWPQKGQFKNKKKVMSDAEYFAYIREYCTFYERFNPVDYDPVRWASLFKRAGLQYAVLTTKHHDGFSMFDTKTTVNALHRVENNDGTVKYKKVRNHYSIMETPYKKDIVGMFCDAMRDEGLGVGLYFSHPDWMDYDFRFCQKNLYRDPDYTRQSDPEGYRRAMMRHRQQLIELCSNYGPLDRLSLDLAMPMDVWPELKETIKMVRKLQPEMMIRRRGIGPWGDYFTPEGVNPSMPALDPHFFKDPRNVYIRSMPWSKIGGTSDHPGYVPDMAPVDTSQVIDQLIKIVACGGNMQLGFGPGPDGKFHPNVVKMLEELGDWLKINGQAIYSTRPRHDGVLREGDIWFTQSKDRTTTYAIIMNFPDGTFELETLDIRDGADVYMLGYDKPLKWRKKSGKVIIDMPKLSASESDDLSRSVWAFRIRQ